MSKKGKIEPRKEKVPYLGQFSINFVHFGLKLFNETFTFKNDARNSNFAIESGNIDTF